MPSILRLLALPAVVWIITTISPLSLAEGATRIPKSQITILYDAFGRDPSMKKDWGFSALVEIGESGSYSIQVMTAKSLQRMPEQRASTSKRSTSWSSLIVTPTTSPDYPTF